MLKVSHAILHSFDLTQSLLYTSNRTLDLEETKTRSFVQRHCRKARNSVDNHVGYFKDNSGFKAKLEVYPEHEQGFIELTQELATYIYEELRRSDDATPCDILCAQFSESIQNPGESKETSDDAFNGVQNTYFALLILPRKEIFIHSMYGEGSLSIAEVMRTDAALPSPSQKIDSSFVVNIDNYDLVFQDKRRVIEGKSTLLLPELLLECTQEPSHKEVISLVSDVITTVAQEQGINETVALSKAKAYMQDLSETDNNMLVEKVGSVVFRDNERAEAQFSEVFEAKSQHMNMPQKIDVPRSLATRMTKNHTIKTDTGIEITFPTKYAETTDFLEFTTAPDGTIVIQVKQVNAIENK